MLVDRLASSNINKWGYKNLHFHACTKLAMLSNWLYEAHISKKINLLDVHKMVQCSDRVVSRLYLLATIFGVFIKLISEYGPNDTNFLYSGAEKGSNFFNYGGYCTSNYQVNEDTCCSGNCSVSIKEESDRTQGCAQEKEFHDAGGLLSEESESEAPLALTLSVNSTSTSIPLMGVVKHDRPAEHGSRSLPRAVCACETKEAEDNYVQTCGESSTFEETGLLSKLGSALMEDPLRHDYSNQDSKAYNVKACKDFLESILVDIVNPPLPVAALYPATPGVESSSHLQGIPDLESLLADMTLMLKGIQEPVCGICLRNYQLYMLIPYLKLANHHYTPRRVMLYLVRFIFNNFIESNILWVRFKHMIAVKGDQRLNRLYKNLHDLVTYNIYAFSMLCKDCVDLYKYIILPGILREVVSCQESYPQKYLMMAIIRDFGAKLHEETFTDLFSAILQLREGVKIRNIVVRLLEKLQGEHDDDKAQDHRRTSVTSSDKQIPPDGETMQHAPDLAGVGHASASGVRYGSLSRHRLSWANFEKLWSFFTLLVAGRHSINIKDISDITFILTKLSVNFHPDCANRVYLILDFVRTCVKDIIASSGGVGAKYVRQAQLKFCSLLVYLLECDPLYTSMFMPRVIPSLEGKILYNAEKLNLAPPYFFKLYLEIADSLPPRLYTLLSTKLVYSCITMHLKYNFYIHRNELFTFLLREPSETDLPFTPTENDDSMFAKEHSSPSPRAQDQGFATADRLSCSVIAMLIHMTRPQSETPEKIMSFMEEMRVCVSERFSEPLPYVSCALVSNFIRIVKQYVLRNGVNLGGDVYVQDMLRSLYHTIDVLCTTRKSSPQTPNDIVVNELGSSDQDEGSACDRRSLQIDAGLDRYHSSTDDLRVELVCEAALLANSCGMEAFTSEFITEAISLYEELQFTQMGYKPLSSIIDTLYKVDVLPEKDYQDLATFCVLRCANLYRKKEKSSGLVLCSHLFWRQGKFVYEKPQLVLQCMEKALKIAVTIGFKTEGRELLLKILQEYLWYYKKGIPSITASRVDYILHQIGDLASSYRPNFYLGKGDSSTEGEALLYPGYRADSNIAETPLNTLLSHAAFMIRNALDNEPVIDKKPDDPSLDDFMGIESYTHSKPETEPSLAKPVVSKRANLFEKKSEGMNNHRLLAAESFPYDDSLEDVRNVWGRQSNNSDSDA